LTPKKSPLSPEEQETRRILKGEIEKNVTDFFNILIVFINQGASGTV
jgi:hypothetical protein